jgi:hypothetical protein
MVSKGMIKQGTGVRDQGTDGLTGVFVVGCGIGNVTLFPVVFAELSSFR